MNRITASIRGKTKERKQQSNRSVQQVREDCDLLPVTMVLTMEAKQ